jgi:hypothetical protein
MGVLQNMLFMPLGGMLAMMTIFVWERISGVALLFWLPSCVSRDVWIAQQQLLVDHALAVRLEKPYAPIFEQSSYSLASSSSSLLSLWHSSTPYQTSYYPSLLQSLSSPTHVSPIPTTAMPTPPVTLQSKDQSVESPYERDINKDAVSLMESDWPWNTTRLPVPKPGSLAPSLSLPSVGVTENGDTSVMVTSSLSSCRPMCAAGVIITSYIDIPFRTLENFVGSIHKNVPSCAILVYDFGLTPDERTLVTSWRHVYLRSLGGLLSSSSPSLPSLLHLSAQADISLLSKLRAIIIVDGMMYLTHASTPNATFDMLPLTFPTNCDYDARHYYRQRQRIIYMDAYHEVISNDLDDIIHKVYRDGAYIGHVATLANKEDTICTMNVQAYQLGTNAWNTLSKTGTLPRECNMITNSSVQHQLCIDALQLQERDVSLSCEASSSVDSIGIHTGSMLLLFIHSDRILCMTFVGVRFGRSKVEISSLFA